MNSTAEQPDVLMTTYKRIAVDMVRGDGNWLIDSEGRRYLDAISGIGVCALGHSHPGFTQAIAEQAATLVHTSNLYGLPLQRELGRKLAEASGMETVFFCNSGAEGNEGAIKLARMYGHQKGIDLPQIVVMEDAFHGRTMGALTATHSNRHQDGFAPLLDGFLRVPYDDVPALRECLAAHPNAVAVLVEPIQGEGGVVTPAADYLAAVRAACDEHDCLMMLDEVQTGNGRTGRYFAYQHANILPDVVSTAKGLGNGFPIGALLAAGPAAHLFQPGHHATTFGGSPLACAAALAVNQALLDEQLIDNAQKMGDFLLEGLRQGLAGCGAVVSIRGQGLMIGVELNQPCTELLDKAREKGVLINIAAGKVIRLLPCLTISQEEAALIVTVVTELIREYTA